MNKARKSKYTQLITYYNPEDLLIFDIETTGFTAENTTLYLIGCCYYQDNEWTIKQWFNNDGTSEQDILNDFVTFVKNFKILIHYNGDGFDIPYVTKKINKYHIDFAFSSIESVDIYKQIKFLKDILHLDNLKQKSVEKFLCINRLDKYTGGDLIKVYQEFIGSQEISKKQLLLQHNYEDLEGLMDCCSLLSYVRLKAGCFQVQKMSVKKNNLIFSLSLDYSLPRRMSIGLHNISVTGYKNEGTITVPIVDEELKFFLDNYKEYYYLPAEDMAVHKSVASYVDKNYREQAKKENCYLKKQGYFISQIDNGILTGYKRGLKEKETFIELTDSFLQDLELLNAYARHIIKLALS